MIKLKHIKRQGETIICDAYVEDCAESISLVFNIAENSMQNSPLPKGYEWCVTHINHARAALARMAEAGDIKENWNIYWC